MQRYSVEIKGVTPLLMNKPAAYGFDQQWIEKTASTDWQKESLSKLYVDIHNRPCQPSTHIEQALIEAGKKLKIKGAGKSTYSKLFGSMVSVEPEEIIHINDKYETYKCLVVIPATKGRVMRYRPIFKDWGLRFTVVADIEIPGDAIKEALEIAGRYVGIGDWRPSTKGKYGKFEVVKFEKIIS